MVVEEVETDWCGEIVLIDRDLHTLTLEDRRNRRRTFPLGPGFLLEGKPVILTRPITQAVADPQGKNRLGIGRRPRGSRHGSQREPDLRRGPARCRIGREGLG